MERHLGTLPPNMFTNIYNVACAVSKRSVGQPVKPERKPEPVDGLCGVSLSNQGENLSPSTLDGLEFLLDLDFHIFQ